MMTKFDKIDKYLKGAEQKPLAKFAAIISIIEKSYLSQKPFDDKNLVDYLLLE